MDRLNDGDSQDRHTADEVVSEMRSNGYVYEGGRFISRSAILVNGHMHPEGCWTGALTDGEKEQVLRLQGTLLPEMDRAIDESRWLDLPEILLDSLAEAILKVRVMKHLPFEPRDFEQ